MILDPKEKVRRNLLRFKGIESGQALIGPATVQLDLTSVCNLECRFCYHFAPGSPFRPVTENHLPFQSFQSIIGDCKDLHVDAINLNGVGDPIFHPNFYEMLKDLEKSFYVTVTTNATFPIERCRDVLRADCIVINLGEADREGYRTVHGRDLLMEVVRNIRELAKLRAKLNPDFRIEVAFVETQLNAQSFSRTEAMAKKLGVDVVQRIRFLENDHAKDIILSDEKKQDAGFGEWPACYHGWFYSSIQSNGDVNVCGLLRKVKIGNVREKSFKDVWESRAYASVRQSALTGDPFKKYEECAKCLLAWRNKEIGVKMAQYQRNRGA